MPRPINNKSNIDIVKLCDNQNAAKDVICKTKNIFTRLSTENLFNTTGPNQRPKPIPVPRVAIHKMDIAASAPVLSIIKVAAQNAVANSDEIEA